MLKKNSFKYEELIDCANGASRRVINVAKEIVGDCYLTVGNVHSSKMFNELSQLGVQALLIYMLIYIVTNLGVFACIISLEKNEGETISNTDDLSGLSKKYPFISFSMAMLMFSFAGIPPLAGFFGKYLIFRSAIENGLIEIAVFGLIISVVAAFYYIRIIKIMYFDESSIKITMLSSKGLNITNVICTIFIVFFIFIYSIFPISELADLAASSIN